MDEYYSNGLLEQCILLVRSIDRGLLMCYRY